MSIAEFITYSVYIGVATFAALVVVTSTGLLMHAGTKVKNEPLVWLFLLSAVVIVAGPIASGRNLSGYSVFFEADIETISSALWINRSVNLLVLLLAIERIIRFIYERPKPAIQGIGLYLSYLVFILTNGVINAIWGTVPSFSHQAIYMGVAALALTMISNMVVTERVIFISKISVISILGLSAIVALAQPSIVLEKNYAEGLIPFRYWGLGTHANTLGPLIVLALICLWYQPFNNVRVNRLMWLFVGVSLILTQSKTSIIAGLVSFAILLYFNYRSSLKDALSKRKFRGFFIALLVFALVIISSLVIVQVFFDFSQLLKAAAGTRAGGTVASLSNRDLIWGFAIQEWSRNNWFGYGPSIFDLDYRRSIGLSLAYHAHNQFMQSLSSAGYFGAAGLLLFILTLGRYALRAAERSRGLSLALFSFLIVRGITEVPLSLSGVANGEFFFLMLTFMVCVSYSSDVKENVQTNVGSRLKSFIVTPLQVLSREENR